MAQPFQFDIFGAPPADIGPGIAAYSQGMGNAAQLYSQTGQMFSPLRQVAQDFMRAKQAQALQAQVAAAEQAAQQRALAQDYQQFQVLQALREREQQALESYRAATLSHQKEEMGRSMGLKGEELSIARRNAELRERGLDLERLRADIAMMREKRGMDADAARAQSEQRLRIAQQLRMIGDPNLDTITDPTQHGEVEGLLRGMFRQLSPGGGGEAQFGPPAAPQGGELMQQIVPGVQMPELPPAALYGLDKRPSDPAPSGQGQPQATAPAPARGGDQRALRDALVKQVAQRVKSGHIAPEQAEALLAGLREAAGIK